MDEISLDRDWNIDINLSGLQAATGKPIDVAEGYYKGKVTDMYVNPERNAARVVIKLAIIEGTYAGAPRTTGMNMPKNADDGVRYYWRAFAESAGYSPAQLDAGNIQLGRDTFLDREVHFYYAPSTEGTYEQLDFLPPAVWQQQKQLFDQVNANKEGEAVPQSVPPENPGGANSILDKLGVNQATA